MNVDYLKNILIQNNISIYKLSKISGVADSRLIEIINKKTKKPQITTIVKIAKALDLTNDEFAELCGYDKAKKTGFLLWMVEKLKEEILLLY